MRGFLMGAAAMAGLLTAGCDGRVRVRSDRDVQSQAAALRSISRLDCPERQDGLRRTEAAGDGRSCAYVGGDGTEVRLQLVALDGRTAPEVLALYQAELQTLLPPDRAGEFDVEVNADHDGDEAHIRLPGISIDAHGENASVRVGNSVSVDADGDDDVVRIRSNDETVNIRAEKGGRAEIRSDTGRNGSVRSTYILASDDAGASGYRLAGYEARGPASGPMVVAVVKARSRENDDSFDAMKALVQRNVEG